jgi:hypothetical protein
MIQPRSKPKSQGKSSMSQPKESWQTFHDTTKPKDDWTNLVEERSTIIQVIFSGARWSIIEPNVMDKFCSRTQNREPMPKVKSVSISYLLSMRISILNLWTNHLFFMHIISKHLWNKILIGIRASEGRPTLTYVIRPAPCSSCNKFWPGVWLCRLSYISSCKLCSQPPTIWSWGRIGTQLKRKVLSFIDI